MRTKLLAVLGVLIVLVIAGVGIAAVTSSSSNSRPHTFSHAQYVHMFASATVGKMSIAAVDKWPLPYQTYVDQYGQKCFEWNDVGHSLLNLCFKTSGRLALKVME